MQIFEIQGWRFTRHDDGSVSVAWQSRNGELRSNVDVVLPAATWTALVAAISNEPKGFITRPMSTDGTVTTGLPHGGSATVPGFPLVEYACTCGHRGAAPCPQHGGR